MASKNAPRDKNFVPAALFEIDGSNGDVSPGQIDQITGRILVDATGGTTTFQTDVFTATNGQSTFTATKTVVYTIGFFIQTILTPGEDYAVGSGIATLDNLQYPGGVPQNTKVVWVYITT